MTDWPRGGYASGDTPASELEPPPEALRSQSRRLENATYTAAEVKVLTAKAGDFGYQLGRKAAAEEIAAAIEALDAGRNMAAYVWSAQTARDIGKGNPNG